MTIGVSPIGSAPIGASAGEAAGNTVALSAAIDLDTRPAVNLFAPIQLAITDAVDLSAAISLRTDTADLSAAISLRTYDAVDLSAAISLQTYSQTNANATAGFWTLQCYIDGNDFSDKLTNEALIEYSEDDSGLATVVVYPDAGLISLPDYVGKNILVAHLTLDDTGATLSSETLFNGYISDPIYDPDTGRLQLECTTDLVNALNKQSRAAIEALIGGGWSPVVFEEGAQGYEYATDRLRTRPASMWHSPGGIVVTDWAAKSTADLEFTDDEVVDGTISYTNATRQDLLNQVNISFDYRFQRLRQRTLSCNFVVNTTFCNFLINGFKLPQRSMIESAANGGGWVLQGEVRYVDLPAPGYYRCFPFASSSQQKYIGWGKLGVGGLLKDPDVDQLCWGASWKASKRWSQSITERYDIVISAPQSQAGNGEIVNTESYSLQSEQDVSDWLEEEKYEGVGNKIGFAAIGDSITSGQYVLGDQGYDATEDLNTGRDAAEEARQVMIDAAVTDVLQAHRSTSVSFTSTFQPGVDLTKTVRLNATGFVAKGKVRSVIHRFSFDSGIEETDITLAISRHFGSGLVTTSPTTADSPPSKPTETNLPRQKYMPTRIGGRTDSLPLDPDWDGYFTNYIYDPTQTQPFATDPTNPATVTYPEQFVCEYPEISGTALDNTELPATQSIDVDIPQDELTMTQ